MYPAWIIKQIDTLTLKHSEDLGHDKSRAMAHCWANMYIMGASYPDPVHDIIDGWEKPTWPQWKNEWSKDKFDALDTPSFLSCEDIPLNSNKILRFEILNNNRNVQQVCTTPSSTPTPPPPPPAPPTAKNPPDLNFSYFLPQPSKWKNGRTLQPKQRGENIQEANKNRWAGPTEAFYGWDHSSPQSAKSGKASIPPGDIYFSAHRQRKEPTSTNIGGQSATQTLANEPRMFVSQESKHLQQANNGNKKTSRLDSATQSVQHNENISTRMRNNPQDTTRFQSDEKVYHDDCELMRRLNFEERPSIFINTKERVKKKENLSTQENPIPGTFHPQQYVQNPHKAPTSLRLSVKLLKAWAKHSQMKLEFLQNKQHFKLIPGEEIKVSVWFDGVKIGQAMDAQGDTYQAKLSAAKNAVTWLVRESPGFKEFKNSRQGEFRKNKKVGTQFTQNLRRNGKKGQKSSPKFKSLFLSGKRTSRRNSNGIQSINVAAVRNQGCGRDTIARKVEHCRGEGYVRKSNSSTIHNNPVNEDLVFFLPLKSPKGDKHVTER